MEAGDAKERRVAIQLANKCFHFGAAMRKVHQVSPSTTMADPIA